MSTPNNTTHAEQQVDALQTVAKESAEEPVQNELRKKPKRTREDDAEEATGRAEEVPASLSKKSKIIVDTNDDFDKAKPKLAEERYIRYKDFSKDQWDSIKRKFGNLPFRPWRFCEGDDPENYTYDTVQNKFVNNDTLELMEANMQKCTPYFRTWVTPLSKKISVGQTNTLFRLLDEFKCPMEESVDKHSVVECDFQRLLRWNNSGYKKLERALLMPKDVSENKRAARLEKFLDDMIEAHIRKYHP